MDEPTDSLQELLEEGPKVPLLPEPVERRRLREMWGASLTEVADALGADPGEMRAWEDGEWDPGPEDARAYHRLLHGFRHRMPAAYEPDWAALRTPKASPTAVDSCDHRHGTCPQCAHLKARATTPSKTSPSMRGTSSTAAASDLILETSHGSGRVTLHSAPGPGEGEMTLKVTTSTSTGQPAHALEGHLRHEDLRAVGELLQQAAHTTGPPPPSSPAEAAPPGRLHRPCTGACRARDSDSEACVNCDGWVCVSCGRVEVEGTPDICGACAADDEGLDEPIGQTATTNTYQTKQRSSAPQAKRRQQRWTEQEREQLLARYEEGATPRQIARELHRTQDAIHWQLYQLDAAPLPEKLRPW